MESSVLWVLFISLVGALISGFVLLTGGMPTLGRALDVFFGLSMVIFVGSLVIVVARRAVSNLLFGPGDSQGQESGETRRRK